MRGQAMRVMGMMSGTSADGIDVALARISGAPPNLTASLERSFHIGFPRRLRDTILRIANGTTTTAEEISQLNFLVGEQFAAAAIAASRAWKIPLAKVDLIGSHGQTIFHQGKPRGFLGMRPIASTLQIGEPSIIAQRTGVTTIADFRPADMAAGGQGAPLVPFVDYLLYRDAKIGRVALNIGGIANVTVIPARARRDDVFAFDTGPGNMVVDALIEITTRGRERFDRNARLALRGKTIPALLERLLQDAYLYEKPPKTAGREQFGHEFAERIIKWGRAHRAKHEDLVRTATVFTSFSIAHALRGFVFPRVKVKELIAAGGGTRNPLMMAQLAAALPEIYIRDAEQFGVATEAKEAFAFAVLAYEAFHGRSNQLPSATGANQQAVLGKLVRGRTR